MALWVVRAGKHGEQEQEVLDENIIAIGWTALPDLSKIEKKEELKAQYEKIYSDEKKAQVSNRVGQIYSFLKRIQKGDLVGVPLKTQSSIAIGEIKGDYEYKKDSPNTNHRRKVEWKKIIPRSEFDQDILYGFGAYLTVGEIKSAEKAEERVKNMINNIIPKDENDSLDDDEQDKSPLEFDFEQILHDNIIKFLDKKFRGHKLETLINEILKSKGYTTQLSSSGKDGGVDILVGSGKLGFDEPKICVQVKSSSSPVDVRVLRELDGVVKKFGANYGILVAWGGLNKPAAEEIKGSFFTTKLWDQGKIVNELIDNYDKLDSEIKSEIPLRKLWTIIEE